jgi:hypothetical protein
MGIDHRSTFLPVFRACHLRLLFIPSTHQVSTSSRVGIPVSSLGRSFRPTNKPVRPDAPPASFSNGLVSVIGRMEKGKRTLPRSASGEPSVQSSQSRIPITLGSVGWKICHKCLENTTSATYQVVNLEIAMHDPSYSSSPLLVCDQFRPLIIIRS